MSFPPDSPSRGCAAKFPQPIDQTSMNEAQSLMEDVRYFNCDAPPPHQRLRGIVYRSSSQEEDILRHVFRWYPSGYQQIFQNGFQAVQRDQDTTNEEYFSLDHHIHYGGPPLDPLRPPHAFISTTLNSAWHPSVRAGEVREVYRYEIYAPGGIWVAATLGGSYQYPSQDEVCFVAGIAPQYIRSAQLFRLTSSDGWRTTRERVDNIIRVNGYFNPQSHPSRLLYIQRPVFDYVAEDVRRPPLTISIYRPQRQKRHVSTYSTTLIDWYAKDVANSESYVDAAFRSSRTNEAYLFMKNEYVRLNYAPGTTDDRVLNGPLLICDGYPSLQGTAFAEHGIDCAFRSASNEDEAFIFSGNLCALIIYAPGTTDDKIKEGPKTITSIFPFLEGTVFEKGVDAAFESTTVPEAYLFKGNKYVLINYGPNSRLIHSRFISEGFPSLRNTIFESGIDAAFASHKTKEAYIFKGASYALINFASSSTDDYIIGGVKPILPNFPSLRSILPRKNRGLDVHVHIHVHETESSWVHDEL